MSSAVAYLQRCPKEDLIVVLKKDVRMAHPS
jgi:hypothetical protein